MMALEGVKIIDLTRLAPGPFCTMLLADLGADVLKIEEPSIPAGRRASQAEGAGTALPPLLSPDSPYHALHRNKKSIVINLKTEEGKSLLYKLTKKADVLVEQMRPGVSKRLGIDYETIKRLNPQIVYCSITGYGQNGPYRDMAGHDINYISFAGALSLIGERGRRPTIPLNILGDYAGGSLYAAMGILAAIIARGKTGRGQYVDISMTDGVVSLLTRVYSDYFESGVVPERGNHFISGAFPFYDVYETKDEKYVTIGSIEPWFYSNLCKALGRDDLIQWQGAKESKKEEIRSIFQSIFRNKTRDEWFEILSKADICGAKVLSLDEAVGDHQMKERRMFVELNHPEKGKIKQVGIAVKLSETPGSIRSFPPRRGEHTEEVLEKFGYTKDEIALMREKKCIE
jgi:crotonobetainyl-CoA:carnitine CoA-transferase CaiB-like acyl-CoA transferase